MAFFRKRRTSAEFRTPERQRRLSTSPFIFTGAAQMVIHQIHHVGRGNRRNLREGRTPSKALFEGDWRELHRTFEPSSGATISASILPHFAAAVLRNLAQLARRARVSSARLEEKTRHRVCHGVTVAGDAERRRRTRESDLELPDTVRRRGQRRRPACAVIGRYRPGLQRSAELLSTCTITNLS